MDYMDDLYELCETISAEIAEANEKIRQSGGKITGSDVEYIDKLTHTLKSIKAVMAMMESEQSHDGGSYDGGSYDGGSYSRGSYDGGSYRGGSYSRYSRNSYARGRGRNAKRDSMGRYASDGGYSRHGDLAEELQNLMQEAPNESVRREMQKLVDKLGQM